MLFCLCGVFGLQAYSLDNLLSITFLGNTEVEDSQRGAPEVGCNFHSKWVG
jgi:hypothetical protein